MLVIWLKSSIKFPFVVSKSLINYLFIEIIHQIYENENIFFYCLNNFIQLIFHLNEMVTICHGS